MEQSQLRDFHPYDTGLTEDIQALLSRSRRSRRSCERDSFLALLAGVPALRKTPGLPEPDGPNYFTILPRCATEADTAACREHLKTVFGITDRETLQSFADAHFLCQNDYLAFEGFWEGRPPFDPASLPSFLPTLRDFSAQFYPLLGHKGYLAWDISESVGLLRTAFACGLLSREEFDSLTEGRIAQAQIFGSWEEYAASLVSGALYWDFRQGTDLPGLHQSKRLWMDLVRTLLANDNAWDSGYWYVPERKKRYRLWPSEMRLYLPDWEGPNGCLVTDRIAVDGCPVGWCCREEPDSSFPDSGWRFFSGDESGEYIADISHTDVTDLNSVCNYDPEIVPLLNAPYRSAFARGEDGKFRPESFEVTEE